MVTQPTGGNQGPATDRQNEPVIDPTRNVLQLVEAAISRQDDLRQMATDHVNKVIEIREQHNREMRRAEAERINAIREVDVAAVQRAAEVQAAQAATLAAQVQVSAEALRIQVQATALAADTNLKAALEPIQKDIADLRRVQYEAAGSKSQVGESRQVNAEKRQISGSTVAMIGLIVTIVLATLTIVGVLVGTGP